MEAARDLTILVIGRLESVIHPSRSREEKERGESEDMSNMGDLEEWKKTGWKVVVAAYG